MKKHSSFIALFVILMMSQNVISQINQQNTQTGLPNQPSTSNQGYNQSNASFKINADAPDLLSQFNSQTVQQKTFPVDKSVNPENYYVGPNDMFNLGIYGYVNQTIPLVVNLEGSILIPTVGEIKVDGLKLSEAKEKVIRAVKKRYYSSDVSLTLSSPRVFLISVSSSVQKKIEVTPLTRTSDIINTIFFDTLDLTKYKYKSRINEYELTPELSLRNIEIFHKDGTSDIVDLYQYFYTNDDKFNPFFREGDLLRVPYGLLIKNYITVEGAVQLPGSYEYNKDDNLTTVIALGRGLDADAEKDSIVVYRIDPSTSKYKPYFLSYESSKDFKINVYDRVFVKSRLDNIKNLSVTVLGEVKRPGVYPITMKNTTLKEVVEMAGGFKPTAYLPLCLLIRKYDEEYTRKDTAEIFLNIRANDLIVKEMDRTNFDIDVLSRRHRMVVDFEKLFKDNIMSENIVLENKDIIYINDNKNVVYVYGQVENEGYVPFKEGENFKYYISKAGGYSLAADEGNTRIIRFNSRGWYKADHTEVKSGDFIYIPKEVGTSFSENLTLVATIIGTLVSIISTYLLIKSTNK